MKKTVLHSVLLILPFLIGLYLIKPDRRYQFKELKDDCLSKGIWMYDRIHSNTEEIDIVFMGSSHTINAVNDKLIQQQLSDSSNVVNFGYCRLGRNIQLTLLKEIVSKKNPKQLFLEIRARENPASHPIYPYLASSKDVGISLFHGNPEYLHDAWLHGSSKLELLQEKIYAQGDSLHIFPWNHGIKVAKDTANPKDLERRSQKSAQSGNTVYPKNVLKRIAKLCQQEGIRLCFIYVPSYAEIGHVPADLKFYKQLGEIWMPPESLMLDKSLWYDHQHLNEAGASEFSKWLIDALQNL